MPASRNEALGKQAPVAVSPRLEAFLEMLAAERGAARLTLAAYQNDLTDLSGFLAGSGRALDAADAGGLARIPRCRGDAPPRAAHPGAAAYRRCASSFAFC